MCRTGKSIEAKSRLVAVGRENGSSPLDEYRVLFWGDENDPELDSGGDCTAL